MLLVPTGCSNYGLSRRRFDRSCLPCSVRKSAHTEPLGERCTTNNYQTTHRRCSRNRTPSTVSAAVEMVTGMSSARRWLERLWLARSSARSVCWSVPQLMWGVWLVLVVCPTHIPRNTRTRSEIRFLHRTLANKWRLSSYQYTVSRIDTLTSLCMRSNNSPEWIRVSQQLLNQLHCLSSLNKRAGINQTV